MTTTRRTSRPGGTGLSGRAIHRSVSAQVRLLIAALACTSISGCGGAAPTEAQKATGPASASVVVTLSPAGSLTSSPTPSPTPTPSLTPTSSPTSWMPFGWFNATGSPDPHADRAGATATLLRNDNVLIVGGGRPAYQDPEDAYASAELYNPATGKFTATGSMAAARIYATATLLPDGDVLIAGGAGCSSPKNCTGVYVVDGLGGLASAELYNPTTGKFTKVGSMAAPRIGATATLLPDGRVLLYGYADQAELYNPSTRSFAKTGPKTPNSSFNTATLLPNGKVLLTGDALGGPMAQLYDEKRGTFTPVSLALPAGTRLAMYKGQIVARSGVPETATLLNDGRVLLFDGGYLETYDPATGRCADAGFISPGGRWNDATATLGRDGFVLFDGGGLEGPSDSDPSWLVAEPTNKAVLYDPGSGQIRAGSMQVARDLQTATPLPDGTVLIAGGDEHDDTTFSSAELYVP